MYSSSSNFFTMTKFTGDLQGFEMLLTFFGLLMLFRILGRFGMLSMGIRGELVWNVATVVCWMTELKFWIYFSVVSLILDDFYFGNFFFMRIEFFSAFLVSNFSRLKSVFLKYSGNFRKCFQIFVFVCLKSTNNYFRWDYFQVNNLV